MKLSDLLQPSCCVFQAEVTSRDQLIRLLADRLTAAGAVTDEEAFVRAVHAREEEFSTAIGDGLAIPHGKCDAVAVPALAFASVPGGVDYQSFDGQPVTLAFMVAVPTAGDDLHLRVLAAIARKMVYEETKAALRQAVSYEDVLQVFQSVEIQ